MGELLKPIEAAILEAEQKFYENNVAEASVLIMRPELRSQLAEELGYGWDFDLHSYAGLVICVCDSPEFPNFKLATW